MKLRKNKKKGFSLVELVVVIAIMAIMTAVLAPSLLSYVERSRAQKDNSAMSEVVNSIMLGLADQNIYDEVLCYTATDNISCYVDGLATYDEDHSSYTPTKKSGSTVLQYMFDDNARLEDENPYSTAGVMRGVTITFEPEQSTNKSCFVLYNGIINKHGGTDFIYGEMPSSEANDDGELLLGGMASFSAPNNHYLYNRIRSTVGDKIELTSQTYRNSEYTVFIRMGTTGGNQADKQDAITVYGQWNGTNLSYGNSGTPGNGVEVGGSHASCTNGHVSADGEILCTWSEIKAIADDGKADEYFNLGDTKTMTLSDETAVVMQIVAFDADDKADGSGKAGITWISKGVLPRRAMNSNSTNANGWVVTPMRSWLQNDFYATMPYDVQNAVVSVVKTYRDYTTASTLECEDTIWLPSYREVFGESDTMYSDETYGCDYVDFFVNDASRIKVDGGNVACSWWLRGANNGVAGITFHIVTQNGTWSAAASSSTANYVVIGFCT